jgi:hypothetical protein
VLQINYATLFQEPVLSEIGCYFPDECVDEDLHPTLSIFDTKNHNYCMPPKVEYNY